jgi:flagellar hook protein FlgE
MGFESLYIGATGMKTHGRGIENLSNNLANVNTLGFKSTDVYFENLMSDYVTTGGSATGLSQQGHGVGLAAIMTNFAQGAPLPGADETDLAITGKGFFRVVNGDTIRYTRAGNFRFNNEGYLVDPHGFRVQGRRFAPPGSDLSGGDVTDIRMNIEEDANGYQYYTVDPVATTSVSMSPNLGVSEDKTSVAANPFFSLLSSWNSSAENPLGDGAFSLANSIKIYDEEGGAHELTVYFDPVDQDGTGGQSYYEYVVGIDPDEDGRAGMSGADAAGLLMAGTMTFNSFGQLADISAYTQTSGASGGLDLASWTPAALSADGYPSFDVAFVSSNASTATQTIALNLGLYADSAGWSSAAAADSVGSNASNLNGMAQGTLSAFASTNYPGATSIMYQDQNGFARGYLQSVNVDQNGVILGQYSNGLNAELYQVTLYTFRSPYGLYREGNNHFSANDSSGAAIEGSPGDYNAVAGTSDELLGLGTIQSNSIEASNVDMAEEFATMIVTERGFQANSKVITTTDTLLQQAIQMKR